MRALEAEVKECSSEVELRNKDDHLQYSDNLVGVTPFIVHCKIFGRRIPCLLDTGADISIVTAKYGNPGLKSKSLRIL